MIRTLILILFGIHIALIAPHVVYAQEDDIPEEEEEYIEPVIEIHVGSEEAFVGQNIDFAFEVLEGPEDLEITEVLWDFGRGTQTTGATVSHEFTAEGEYTVRVRLATNHDPIEEEVDIRVFERVITLVADFSVTQEEIELKRRQARQEGVLLFVIQPRTSAPEAIIEDDLTSQLLEARDAIKRSNIIITYASGSIGPSVLSKFAQQMRQSDKLSMSELALSEKGIVILSNTSFGVLGRATQLVFDQLQPNYVLITRPEQIDALLRPITAEEARATIVSSPIEHKLFGTFSARAVDDIGITNIVSVGINYLINQGVPTGNITLILMLPVIATILSFSRQVVGIKAFGIITPAMTTLTFLVMGLKYGLVFFAVILLVGTGTRIITKKFQLLYLPRMALVLTMISVAILVIFGLGAAMEKTVLFSLSIFPILILTLLAEEFIALQFKSGAKTALKVTAWTLGLSILCYFIVSWQLLRTIIISYPEVVLLAIPINILFGRWTGLRLTEYVRFRKLGRYIQ